jgi:AcrR family transcriptional regulator
MARVRANDFEEKQRLILESAAAVFAEMGMEKASMAQIATRARVSKPNVYHYYQSKDALIFDIINTHLIGLDAAVSAADDPTIEPAVRLHRLILAVLESYRNADDYHKVQLNAMSALSDLQRQEIRVVERRIVGRFSDVIRLLNPKLDNKERPLLSPVTMTLFGILNWVYMWFREGGSITREDYAKIVTTLMLEGVKAIR